MLDGGIHHECWPGRLSNIAGLFVLAGLIIPRAWPWAPSDERWQSATTRHRQTLVMRLYEHLALVIDR
jgi:hypothetical protein